VRTRIGGREAIAKSIDKGGSKTRDTTERQECHAHEIRDKYDRIGRWRYISASVQQIIDMFENNICEYVKHSKRLLKKPLLQGALKQTPENITIRSHPLHTTAAKDLTREERRANSTHQCKECSNQSIQNLTEQPENNN